jgi:hypothetical protein
VTTFKEQVETLVQVLDESGCQDAERVVTGIAEQLCAPLDEPQIRKALDGLRSKRCFAAVQVLGNRVLEFAVGGFAIYVRRQLAQAYIEQRDYKQAKGILG